MKRTNTESVINFIYFTSNFQYDFIEQIWQGNEATHFRSKLSGIVSSTGKGYVTGGAFLAFVFELSADNKAKLIDWIDKNYNCRMI